MLISSDGWVLCVKLASKGKKHHSLIHEIWGNKIPFKRLFICIASLKHLNCKATYNIISREENEEQGHILNMEPTERKLFFWGWKFWKLARFFFLVLSPCSTMDSGKERLQLLQPVYVHQGTHIGKKKERILPR